MVNRTAIAYPVGKGSADPQAIYECRKAAAAQARRKAMAK